MKVRVTASMWGLVSVGVRENGTRGAWMVIWSGDRRALKPRIFDNRISVHADKINSAGKERRVR
jgi:hypothetical protein